MIRCDPNVILPPRADFCKKLEYLMIKHGYSARKLGREIGMHPNSLHYLLRGKSRPCIQTIGKLTRLFGVSGVWLMRKEKI